ncbi:recombinase family protein [Criibacterium bergeronii]|uniref:Recombinase family protein n=1 Tax=Criibacterium bergeronii TaxID=1871336 RepID=A0A552UVK8_9FIRM|nr:recombinase family protein [Criibacterium bergeronii]TRW22252.1 recombinase family protein [Criibacterium bergeronii]
MNIGSQKAILEDYAKSAGIYNYEFYVDDGYTGMNTNRPAFQDLIQNVKEGLVECVVTKDLSRLGRNYIETGECIEVIFPTHNVRYISVNDGVDTLKDNNEIVPFKNVLNEFYSRDISKKVKSAKTIRMKQGKFMGVNAPFGYKKDPNDKNHLIIDEETASTVKLIFDLALQNMGNNRIIKVLAEKKCPKPAYYKQDYFGEMSLGEDSTYDWKFTPVMRILRNPVYKGGMWERTCQKAHFKQKSRGYIRIADRNILEDVHEAIISKEQWDLVQKNIDSHSKYKPSQNNIDNIFRGKLICEDCGHTLLMHTESKGKKPPIERTHYYCTSYSRRGAKFCSAHKIYYLNIYDILLKDINACIKSISLNKEEFIQKLAKKYDLKSQNSTIKIKTELEKLEKRYSEIDNLFIKVYDDYAKGILDGDRFNLVSQNYSKEQIDLKIKIKEMKDNMKVSSKQEESINSFVYIIEQCCEIKELNSVM